MAIKFRNDVLASEETRLALKAFRTGWRTAVAGEKPMSASNKEAQRRTERVGPGPNLAGHSTICRSEKNARLVACAFMMGKIGTGYFVLDPDFAICFRRFYFEVLKVGEEPAQLWPGDWTA